MEAARIEAGFNKRSVIEAFTVLTGLSRKGKRTHSQKSVTMNHTGPLM